MAEIDSSASPISIGCALLAAGAATRMGKPKQLLPYGHSTLLQHAVRQAIGAGFQRIVVVTGANAVDIEASISHLSVEMVHNPAWETGMGSSITAGVSYLLERKLPLGGIAILLGDQPLVRAEQLASMRKLLEDTSAPMVAARYGGTLGVPAFFKPEMFSALVSLPPSAGARHLLNFPGARVVPFDLPEASVDIDTPDDFAALGAV